MQVVNGIYKLQPFIFSLMHSWLLIVGSVYLISQFQPTQKALIKKFTWCHDIYNMLSEPLQYCSPPACNIYPVKSVTVNLIRAVIMHMWTIFISR